MTIFVLLLLLSKKIMFLWSESFFLTERSDLVSCSFWSESLFSLFLQRAKEQIFLSLLFFNKKQKNKKRIALRRSFCRERQCESFFALVAKSERAILLYNAPVAKSERWNCCFCSFSKRTKSESLMFTLF